MGLAGRRLGGPSGRHARPTGLFYDPAPWVLLAATLLWWVRMLHQSTCMQTNPNDPIKTMLRMCYSDVPIVWSSNGWSRGLPTLGDATQLPQLPVISFFISVQRIVLELFLPAGSGLTAQQELNLGNAFMVTNAVVLFCFFLAWVVAHMLMGRDSTRGRSRDARGHLVPGPARSFDALFIASSVGILSTGLIAWDLVAPALAAVALMLWTRGQVLAAGVVTGIALGAGIAPVVLVLALAICCVRAGQLEELLRYSLGLLAALVLVVALAATQSAAAVRRAYLAQLDPESGLGSMWYILKDAGLAGQLVPGLSKAAIAIAFAGIALLALRSPRRPRVAQLACLFMLAGLMLAPTYSPQYVLWALGWVALARPNLRDWAIYSGAELLYFLAVWGHLQGNIRLGGGEDIGYPLAIIIRLAASGWIVWTIVRDMLEPWSDPIRRFGADDPQGGTLDGVEDADWMTTPPLPAR